MGQEEKRVRKVREAVARGRDPQGPSTMGSTCHGSPGYDLPWPGWSVMGLVFFPELFQWFCFNWWPGSASQRLHMYGKLKHCEDRPTLALSKCRKPITIHLTLPRKSLPLADGQSVWIDCAVSSWRAGEGQPPLSKQTSLEPLPSR